MSLQAQRQTMLQRHLAARDIHDHDVLDAMEKVPRERFVASGMEEFAYDDSPLPIGEWQTISQPYIVALMAQAAQLQPGARVLEVGTGSGYAAAVLAELAAEVFTIERHASLAEQARKRLEALGYRQVHVHIGDGSQGWQEHAPFDAILVAAGSPDVPPALKQQLAIGGRLVIPVGGHGTEQTLKRIVRTGPGRWRDEDLGGVRFVPLIGAHGWTASGERADTRAPQTPTTVPERVAAAAIALPAPEDDAFAEAFDRYAHCRVVLLGECSHGTSEFYRARAAISRRLIEHHGFDFVAVEADWPDAAAIHRHIRDQPQSAGAGAPFQRFPTWMWRNHEFAGFVEWMRDFNARRGDRRALGFHGLDLYNLRGAIASVLHYLDKVDPQAAAVARERYGCLTPWQHDPATYGRAALARGYSACEDAVVRQYQDLLQQHLQREEGPSDGLLDAAHSARLVASAERYYRVMYYGGAQSWNLRDEHMGQTLQLLLDHYGPQSRGIVWAHNSHIGDARHTDMGQRRDELNLGQLARSAHGEAAALVGFGTHTGTVMAADNWDEPAQVMQVRPSRKGSLERLCHDSGQPRFLLDLRERSDAALDEALTQELQQRFIGVIYRPDTELQSHYMRAAAARQYDGYVWFDTTGAVAPFASSTGDQHALPETWPTGL